jgi:hypothetical protein
MWKLMILAGTVMSSGWVLPLIVPAADALPVHKGTRLLKSGRLVVEIDDPTAKEHNQFNRDGRRFSPVAMVLRAQYNGREFLYSPVDGGHYGWVGGAPMEFDLGENTMNKPPGFEEAVEKATDGTGDFLKVGVGILRKTTPVYQWFHDYPAVELAHIQTTWNEHGDKVTFLQTLQGNAHGYAYELEETLQVKNNQMIMQYRLKNTGQKPFQTEQYIHNFLSFSKRPVGPNYEVRFPYTFQQKGFAGPAIRRQGDKPTLEFFKQLPEAVKFRLNTPTDYQGSNSLTVEQSEIKQSLTIEASLPSEAVDLWCTDQQISPEMLLLIKLEPGKAQLWTRTYTFGE